MTSSAFAQGGTSTVSGTVRDELGRPIDQALVVFDADTSAVRVRTDATGRFRIGGIAPGSHELRVVRIGYLPHQRLIDVGPSDIELTIELASVPIPLDTVAIRVSRAGLHGRVVTRGIELMPHDPRPLPGATIEVIDQPYRTTTQRDGTFSVGELGVGSYTVLVRLDRYQSRLLPVHVPPEGGVDITVVLDSTIADWQRRDDQELRDISWRQRWAPNPSAFVSRLELVGPPMANLNDALRLAPSALNRGLLVNDAVTCIFLDGVAQPRMTAKDVYAEDVHSVEVYSSLSPGADSSHALRWPVGAPCGTGVRLGPYAPIPERWMEMYAKVALIWTGRRR